MTHTARTVDNPVTGERISFLRTAAETGGELLATGERAAVEAALERWLSLYAAERRV
jgi:hypothetical protein